MSEDLARLFAELKTAGSPIRRMKILGRAWRTLRRLSPKARKDLAAQVGIDGAEDVLEQLAGPNRKLSPAALLAALDALRSSNPEDLQRTLSDLRRPAGRRALLDRGIDLLVRHVDATDEASAPLSPAPPTALDAVTLAGPTPAVPGSAAVTAPKTATTTPARRQAAIREEKRRPPAPAEPAAPKTVVHNPALRTPTPSDRPKPPPPPPPPDPWAAPAARVPRRTVAVVDPADVADVDLLTAVCATLRLSAKFRILSDRLDEALGMSVEELRQLIEAFPSEWSRRRALMRLLDERIPSDLHQAMFLVEGLETRMSQRWCVARILHGWSLAAHERKALLVRRGTFIRRAV